MFICVVQQYIKLILPRAEMFRNLLGLSPFVDVKSLVGFVRIKEGKPKAQSVVNIAVVEQCKVKLIYHCTRVGSAFRNPLAILFNAVHSLSRGRETAPPVQHSIPELLK